MATLNLSCLPEGRRLQLKDDKLNMKIYKLFSVFLPFLLIPSVAVSAITKTKEEGAQQNPSVTRQFSAQGTLTGGAPVSITVIAPSSDEGTAQSAMSAALSRARTLDNELFSADGVEAQIERLKAGEPLKLPAAAFEMISKAVELSGTTNGWYDVSAPSDKGVFTQKDWRRIVLDRDAQTISFKSAGMRLDLKRIATGHAVDVMMNALKEAGFSNARVAAGPVERISGRDIFSPWNIRIEFDVTGEYAHRAYNYNLTSVSATTVTPDGLASGLIDARSRKPVAHGSLKSVTVLASDAATATAYALAAYTLGPKVGLRFIEAHPETQGIIVDGAGTLLASKDFKTTAADNAPGELKALTISDGGPDDVRQKEREENADR